MKNPNIISDYIYIQFVDGNTNLIVVHPRLTLWFLDDDKSSPINLHMHMNLNRFRTNSATGFSQIAQGIVLMKAVNETNKYCIGFDFQFKFMDTKDVVSHFTIEYKLYITYNQDYGQQTITRSYSGTVNHSLGVDLKNLEILQHAQGNFNGATLFEIRQVYDEKKWVYFDDLSWRIRSQLNKSDAIISIPVHDQYDAAYDCQPNGQKLTFILVVGLTVHVILDYLVL